MSITTDVMKWQEEQYQTRNITIVLQFCYIFYIMLKKA